MMLRAAGSLILAETTSRVLLLRRTDGDWDQPGGLMDPEDYGDPATTSLRETEEETGLSAILIDCFDHVTVRRLSDGRHVLYMPRAPERAAVEYTVFFCTFREEFVPKLSHEHTLHGWFRLNRLPPRTSPGTRLAIEVLIKRHGGPSSTPLA